ncbi:MAG: histidine phosphatase family protein [Lentisphaeria bacterium]|nr:histidine phosphatase family protein [Lentisphaeria bacterium]
MTGSDTDFTIIRHGQTGANIRGILQGHCDTLLDDTGLAQARCAAERLRGEPPFDAFYSSDLQRASETARIIADAIGLKPVPMPELREWKLGELEGRPRRELQQLYPEIMDSFLFEPAGDVPVPGGETRNAFFARVADCLDRLAVRHKGQRVLLVTHGGVMRAVYRRAAGNIAPGCMIPMTTNASYSRIFYRGGFRQLGCWNDISHLKNIPVKESSTF